ncbi:thiamine pyrophosphate-dependent enzyme [Sebaldella sp. S0638]|uniref:thiamine pyrophosphate-dependent enzyme n=1 Tax=Sebaldella sp. S0638 TaxID=2957809 RepID=UPI00209D3B4B|nr:thiamine pyrophosphate-dependent enzyme [Sebaldella sp. S0638]MCP1225959.1 thiamine pyrophosphate-binding protein [Sebaldella sp. S0638]
MNVSEIIVKILEKEGISDAFGIPGAGINGLYKYLEKSNKIDHYTVRHEECAVHAAGGYYRASGKIAAALCTSGPGATNFVTGIYTANIDSIPIIAITGQAVTSQLGKDAFQCVDIAKICEPIAKATYCITDVSNVVKTFQEAFKKAREGKPGPVVIDLPLDIQLADIDYNMEEYEVLNYDFPKAEEKDIKKAVEMLKESESPVIIMGGGVVLADSCDLLVKFAEKMQIPVITTYMAKGGIPENHPLNAGHAGIQVGQPIGNKVLLDSDLILGVGCRFTDRHTGDIKVYKGNRKFIHINIEKNEIDKIIKADLGIVSDAKYAVKALLKEAETERNTESSDKRIKELQILKKELERKTDYKCVPIKPQRVFKELNDYFDDEIMYTTGCGITQIWSGQLQKINKPRKYLASGGAGTLGYDIPTAFGAMIADKGRKAVAVMGDFGFTFHAQELAVAAKYKVPLIVVLVNNAYLGLIRQNQKYAYGYEYGVEMKENHTMMDYIKVAEGLACAGERVFEPDKIKEALDRAYKSEVPYIIDIVVEEGADCSMGVAIDAIREFV